MVAMDVPEWVQSEDDALAWVLFDHDARALRTWVRGVEVFGGGSRVDARRASPVGTVGP